jgi:two-component system, NarL family, nitrate/nitrite response regulator NarL
MESVSIPAPERAALPRVLTAGNGSAAWQGIRLALQEAEISLCGEVKRAEDLAVEAARTEPDLVLVDVALPGGGIRAIEDLPAGHPMALVMTAEIDVADFLRAMDASAVGYLPMSISPSRLPAVVNAVLAGELAIPRPLIPPLLEHIRTPRSRRHLTFPNRGRVELTTREGEVFELLADGFTTREMADALVISEVTVRRHIGTLLGKLQVGSRREALSLLQGP